MGGAAGARDRFEVTRFLCWFWILVIVHQDLGGILLTKYRDGLLCVFMSLLFFYFITFFASALIEPQASLART